MNRELARIQLRSIAPYYRRVVTQAAREATHPWVSRLSVSAALAVLTFIFSWLITGKSALTGLAVAACTIGAWWLLVVLWFLFTIPPRIENDWRLKEETLRVLSQRRNVANELRNHMIECRTAAQRARQDETGAEGRGAVLTPDAAQTYHQQALHAATHVTERLEWLSRQTGQMPQERLILEIQSAVKSSRVANADEAIAQLEALADVIERQLLSGEYS